MAFISPFSLKILLNVKRTASCIQFGECNWTFNFNQTTQEKKVWTDGGSWNQSACESSHCCAWRINSRFYQMLPALEHTNRIVIKDHLHGAAKVGGEINKLSWEALNGRFRKPAHSQFWLFHRLRHSHYFCGSLKIVNVCSIRAPITEKLKINKHHSFMLLTHKFHPDEDYEISNLNPQV